MFLIPEEQTFPIDLIAKLLSAIDLIAKLLSAVITYMITLLLIF